jgi:hypothetical protein
MRAAKRWGAIPQLQELNGRRAVAAATFGKGASLRLNLTDVKEFARMAAGQSGLGGA